MIWFVDVFVEEEMKPSMNPINAAVGEEQET
jgi:hypothetical protein